MEFWLEVFPRVVPVASLLLAPPSRTGSRPPSVEFGSEFLLIRYDFVKINSPDHRRKIPPSRTAGRRPRDKTQAGGNRSWTKSSASPPRTVRHAHNTTRAAALAYASRSSDPPSGRRFSPRVLYRADSSGLTSNARFSSPFPRKAHSFDGIIPPLVVVVVVHVESSLRSQRRLHLRTKHDVNLTNCPYENKK